MECCSMASVVLCYTPSQSGDPVDPDTMWSVVELNTLKFLQPGKQPRGKIVPSTRWDFPKTAFLAYSPRSPDYSRLIHIVFSFMFPDTLNVLCYKLLWKNHGNLLKHSSKLDFFLNPLPFPNRPFCAALIRWSTFMWVLWREGKKKQHPLPSAFPPIWLPWLWQTQLPHNGKQFHASAFILHWLQMGAGHHVLCWNCMKYTFHLAPC